jgi:hypothetical protein
MEDIQGVEAVVETVSQVRKPRTKSPSKSPKSSYIGVLLILEKNKFSEREKPEVDKRILSMNSLVNNVGKAS